MALVNKKPEVFTALKAALPGGRVCYVAPDDIPEDSEDEDETEQELPFISYHEVDNSSAGQADDAEYATFIEFAIGIWGESSEQITPIAQEVEVQMLAKGYDRTFCTDIPKDSEGTHQKAMRYGKLVPNE